MDDCIESDIVFKWTRCCRLCLTTSADIDIFDSEVMFQEISVKLNTYLSSLVYRGDPMPRKLCQSCWKHLDSWHKFQTQCIETEGKLKTRLKQYSALDFVKDYLRRDDDFKKRKPLVGQSQETLSKYDGKSGSNSTMASSSSVQETETSQGPADSTNCSFVGVPIKIESVDTESADNTSEISNRTMEAFHVEANIVPPMSNNNETCGTDGQDKCWLQPAKEGSALTILRQMTDLIAKSSPGEPSEEEITPVNDLNMECDPPSGSIYKLKVKTNLGYESNSSIQETGEEIHNLSKAQETEQIPNCDQEKCDKPSERMDEDSELTNQRSESNHWHREISHGMITNVKGSADALWRSQPSHSHMWNVQTTLEVKEEPMSPSSHAIRETETSEFCETDSKDKSYNLRPRFISKVNYGEVEDWLEDTPSPRPARQRVTPWKCEACQLYFTSNKALFLHQASLACIGRTMGSFTCRLCPKVFFSEVDLAEHNIIHLKIAYNLTADDLKRCPKCDLSFTDNFRWKEHAKTHAQKKIPGHAIQYPCSDCNLVFIKKASYESHRSTHSAANNFSINQKEERDYACSLCIERFRSEDLLYDHRFATHGIPDERVACTTCSQKFRGPTALEEHKQSHKSRSVARKTTKVYSPLAFPPKSVEAPQPSLLVGGSVRCRRCGHVFATREELARHEARKHKNLNPFLCRKCRRRFPTRSLLLLHQRTHMEGLPPNERKQITENSQFHPIDTGAARVPTSSVDLSCRNCSITFKCQRDLNQHNAAHLQLGENVARCRHVANFVYRYQCTGCPQMFSQRVSGNRHLSTLHEADPFTLLPLKIPIRKDGNIEQNETKSLLECTHCHIKLPSQAVLNFHIKKKHSEVLVNRNEVNSVKEKTETCPYCLRMFSSSYLRKHINYQHRGNRPGYKTIYKPMKQSRLKPVVDNVKKSKLKCRFCAKIISNSYNLLRHERTHKTGGLTNLMCTHCKVYTTTNQRSYQCHLKKCSSKQGTIDITQTPTQSREAASLISDSGEKNSFNSPQHSCSVCLNTYETQNLLELHTMTAHGFPHRPDAEVGQPRERELWREECNKIVREVDGVHRCTFCHVNFGSQEEAAWHRAEHPRGNLYVVQIDDSLYQCTVCDQLFSGRENALLHATGHAEKDVKPTVAELTPQIFYCPFCVSQFVSEETIRNHIHYAHPGGSSIAV